MGFIIIPRKRTRLGWHIPFTIYHNSLIGCPNFGSFPSHQETSGQGTSVVPKHHLIHKLTWCNPNLPGRSCHFIYRLVSGVLVGGIPTPLKNDGVRQLGWWHSQYMEKKIHVPNHQPGLYWYTPPINGRINPRGLTLTRLTSQWHPVDDPSPDGIGFPNYSQTC